MILLLVDFQIALTAALNRQTSDDTIRLEKSQSGIATNGKL
jgi:hypothetical protein